MFSPNLPGRIQYDDRPEALGAAGPGARQRRAAVARAGESGQGRGRRLRGLGTHHAGGPLGHGGGPAR